MKSVVVFSGGLDSTVLLAKLIAEGRTCLALTVDYGQRHRREIESAKAICAALGGITHRVADLGALAPLWGRNSLTDATVDVAEGHYTEERMRSSVVPGRNLLLLATAAAWAFAERCDSLAYGAHGGDHAIYPDCREAFADATARAIALADWHTLALERPFVMLDKTAIVRMGAALRAPMHLSWSCYKGGAEHCGRCGTCIERREAFANAGVEDPTRYAPDAPDAGTLAKNGWKP
ncbi:MAG: 7-cyano-7-deazaguanine synthase QueC [Puniceicoccales bacterium]|jgi:7-cyano-7-deazaguanine synthase|nr:7-cyano-7-deazaguanine synthase QueC [Puniceicoccales bacterium]